MTIPDLRSLEEAASELKVPLASLRGAAEAHGFLIRMGRSLRIDRNDYGKLVKRCQDQPRERDSTSSSTARTGTSETPGNPTAARAAQAAAKLKKPSPRTSPQKGGKVLQMNRET